MPRNYTHAVEKLHDPVESQIDLDGQIVNYAKCGHGPCYILCLPAACGGWYTDYKSMLEWLDVDTFTMVALDVPGYGKSRPPEREWNQNTNKDDADTAHALMAALQLQPFNVFGWGEGGRTAVQMAANENGAQVKRLVIWGTQVNLKLQGSRVYANCRNMQDFCMRMYLRREAYYGAEWTHTQWKKYCDWNTKVFTEEKGAICLDVMKSIEQPVMVMHGDRMRLYRRYAETLKNQLQNCVGLYVHHNGSHDLHIEFRDWFWRFAAPFVLDQPVPDEPPVNDGFFLLPSQLDD